MKNQWLQKVKRTVKVNFNNHLKRTTTSMEVEIEKYNMTHNEKLAAVVQAALKHFAEEINEFGAEYNNADWKQRRDRWGKVEETKRNALPEPIEDKLVQLAVEGVCYIPIHSPPVKIARCTNSATFLQNEFRSRAGICEKVSLK